MLPSFRVLNVNIYGPPDVKEAIALVMIRV